MAKLNMDKEICWITWEDHRRSKELAKALCAQYFYIKSTNKFVLRHLVNSIKTVKVLYIKRSSIIIVQNPSRILACLAALLKFVFGYKLVVDRHTNFRLGKRFSINPAIWFVVACSEISIKLADLTIVTNNYLKEHVEKKGGRSFILADKIPEFNSVQYPGYAFKKGRINILYICTYSNDEPYREVIECGRLLEKDCKVFITGNYNKAGLDKDAIPGNVILTGFVNDDAYINLLNSVDIIMVLTSAEWCLVCGGYEAMSVGKPLITSNTIALREFYGTSVVITDHDPGAIKKAIEYSIGNLEMLRQKIQRLKLNKENEWQRSRKKLIRLLSSI
ncbi:glycosyltransferase [Marinobacter sp. X15-166B]|uniref:glycosyltransferase n=1 Tax=Marinobacter sp. X15-166B TaxID=1897620 RepID=UPI0009F4054C|nr:glycosyltransferase [Marinobacter sp. X15-166B]